MFGKKEEPQIEEKYYKIISTMRISSISDEANKMIAEGWKPQGGIMKDNAFYFQAFVRDVGQ